MFLGGGIVDCEDWQAYARQVLAHAAEPLTILNPRRANFCSDAPDANRLQFRWEQHHLHIPGVIRMFWFPASTVDQTGAFTELVQSLVEKWECVVGCDPGYPRAAHVRLWCETLRPGATVHTYLDHVLKETLTKLHTFTLHAIG